MAAADRHRPRKHNGLDACPAADPSSGRSHAAVLQPAPERRFAVAGGAALIEQGLIQRQTRDVDLFLLDAAASTITSAAASFETAIGERGWSHQRVIDQSDFVRLQITGSGESLIVDLGRDSRQKNRSMPPTWDRP
jgi:predicted nucleotidyltransferase